MSQKTQNPVRFLVPDCGAHTPHTLPCSSIPYSQSLRCQQGVTDKGQKNLSECRGYSQSHSEAHKESLEVTPQGQASNTPPQENKKSPSYLEKAQKTGFATSSFEMFTGTSAQLFLVLFLVIGTICQILGHVILGYPYFSAFPQGLEPGPEQ